MRAGLLAAAMLLAAPVAAAAPSIEAPAADRLRAALAAEAQAARQARLLSQRARLVEDRALLARARADALGAKIAAAEARVEAAQLRHAQATRQLRRAQNRLASGQAPLARLLAALQRMARRPALLLALRPGGLREYVQARAMMAALQPEIARRTRGLDRDVAQWRQASARAHRSGREEHQARRLLAARRDALIAQGAGGRRAADALAARAGAAGREAIVRGSEARGIGAAIGLQRSETETATRLAVLPGPVPRPGRKAQAAAPRPRVRLPTEGRLLTGFGERDFTGAQSTGLAIAPPPGARIAAPLAGKVAFAGPLNGYGIVVILSHEGGLVSIVAGLERSEVAPGDTLAKGASLGTAPQRDPRILYELRRDDRPVHPLLP